MGGLASRLAVEAGRLGMRARVRPAAQARQGDKFTFFALCQVEPETEKTAGAVLA